MQHEMILDFSSPRIPLPLLLPASPPFSSRRLAAIVAASIASLCDLGSAARACNNSRRMHARTAESSDGDDGGGGGNSETRTHMVAKKDSDKAAA